LTDLRALGALAALLALVAAGPVSAADCPGKPDALGTSRTLVVDPTEHIRLGMMQYPETLPLADHEVVLTFDDGPLPAYTNRVLDVLASECVKATYFLVGRMSKAYPDMVRKIYAAGHTIGTHSNSHPYTFHRMPVQQAEAEVEGGIEAAAAALGDRNLVAPFFRIPGLMRGETIERYLASRSLMTWSADFPADDWKHISAKEIVARALQRIEARGRGMLLLHDIQPATALAMPTILSELKRRGYRIVHVVPATPDRAKTATLPSQWLVRNSGRWPAPQISIELLLTESVLPVPAPASFGLSESFVPGQTIVLSRARSYAAPRGKIPLPPESPWSHLQWSGQAETPHASAERDVLPAPSLASFGYGDDFAPMIPEPGSGRRDASFPPQPETKSARREADGDVTSSVRARAPRRQAESSGILRFLFPVRQAKQM